MAVREQAREVPLTYCFPEKTEQEAHRQQEIEDQERANRLVGYALLFVVGLVLVGFVVALFPKIQERIDRWRQLHTWRVDFKSEIQK